MNEHLHVVKKTSSQQIRAQIQRAIRLSIDVLMFDIYGCGTPEVRRPLESTDAIHYLEVSSRVKEKTNLIYL